MQQLLDYLKDTDYSICDATTYSIHEIQDQLKECRNDYKLIVFVEKCPDSLDFFERLEHFKLDEQQSNYYLAHANNYAVWIEPSELTKKELLEFLKVSESTTKIDKNFFEEQLSQEKGVYRVV